VHPDEAKRTNMQAEKPRFERLYSEVLVFL